MAGARADNLQEGVELADGGLLSAADRRVARSLFVVAACCFLLLMGGVAKSGDERSMLELAASLVEDQSVTVPDRPFVGVPGAGGRTVSKYGIGQPVLSIPFHLLGRAVSAPLDDPTPVREAVTMALMPVATALLLAWSYVLARRIGGDPVPAAGVAVAATVGSVAMVYGTEYFAEPLVALLMVIAVERAVADRWTAAFAALSVAMLVHARAAPLLLVLGLVAWRQLGFRRSARAAWPAALGIVVLALYGVVRFGEPFETGYEGEGFTTPVLDGLFGLVFEPSKSVLLFAPLAVAGLVMLPPLHRARPVAAQLIAGFAFTIILLTSTWHSWMGGWSWGPRFLTPIVVLLAVPLASWLTEDSRRWGAVGALAILGFVVSFPALLVPSTLQKDLGGDPIGPSIMEQYELLPDVLRSAGEGECAGDIAEQPLQRCLPALWQVHVTRSVGGGGELAVVVASGGLLLGAVISGVRAAAHVRAAQLEPKSNRYRPSMPSS